MSYHKRLDDGRFHLKQWPIWRAVISMPIQPRKTLRHTDQWPIWLCILYQLMHLPLLTLVYFVTDKLARNMSLYSLKRGFTNWMDFVEEVGPEQRFVPMLFILLGIIGATFLATVLSYIWHADQANRLTIFMRTFSRLSRLSTWYFVWTYLAAISIQLLQQTQSEYSPYIIFLMIFAFIAGIVWLTGESPLGLMSPWPGHCENCGYPRTEEAAIQACPECGHPYEHEAIRNRPIRRARPLKYPGRFHDIKHLPSGLWLMAYFMASLLIVLISQLLCTLMIELRGFRGFRYAIEEGLIAGFVLSLLNWVLISLIVSAAARTPKDKVGNMPIAMRLSFFIYLKWIALTNGIYLIVFYLIREFVSDVLYTILLFIPPIVLAVLIVRKARAIQYRMD